MGIFYSPHLPNGGGSPLFLLSFSWSEYQNIFYVGILSLVYQFFVSINWAQEKWVSSQPILQPGYAPPLSLGYFFPVLFLTQLAINNQSSKTRGARFYPRTVTTRVLTNNRLVWQWRKRVSKTRVSMWVSEFQMSGIGVPNCPVSIPVYSVCGYTDIRYPGVLVFSCLVFGYPGSVKSGCPLSRYQGDRDGSILGVRVLDFINALLPWYWPIIIVTKKRVIPDCKIYGQAQP